MIKVNKEQQRGRGNYGWLRANYSFSFSQYFNKNKMGYKALRVINEDFIAPKAGFPAHGHKNMEILTIVLKGSLGHTDSLGNTQTLTPSKIQRMYAGSGVQHSEFNKSFDEELNLLQIWIEPHTFDLPPEYDEKDFDFQKPSILLASPLGIKGSLKIYQDVEVFILNLKDQEVRSLDLQEKDTYFHIISGSGQINSHGIAYGDSLEIEKEKSIEIKATSQMQILGFKFL